MKEKTLKIKKTTKNSKDDLTSALIKKALGYDYKEVVEEYDFLLDEVYDEGEEK